MPPTGTDEGLRAAELLAKRAPQIGVLVLSDHLELRYATRLLQAGTPGRGYLLKQTVTNAAALVHAIRRVAAGESVVDAEILQEVIGRLRRDDPFGGWAALNSRRRGG